MEESLKHIQQHLPTEDFNDYRSANRKLFLKLNKICIVVDDDPTGNQTVHNIPLLSSWSMEVLIKEFVEGTQAFFLLTNSRSLTGESVAKVYKEIAETIVKVSEITKKKFTVISRSDSTLRGHFPLEPETLQKHLKLDNAITVFLPVMFEGNRVTVNDTHYIKEEDSLVPVNKTPFANDHSFKYSKANLKEYIEEKSVQTTKASEVFSFSLKDIRSLEVNVLAERILEIPPQSYCIFNSLNYADLDKVSHALLLAEKLGKEIVYRTSSSFVPSYLGLTPKEVLQPEDILNNSNNNGGLTIVGSYVKKSSEQLNNALSLYDATQIIEVDVSKILSHTSKDYLETLIRQLDTVLTQGKNAIVFTSRALITGKTIDANVDIASTISQALVDIVRGIRTYPKYIIAKGGITSHDIATKGLGMDRGVVLGQISPGIPIWRMGQETKFPKLPYIVFPGNVGDRETLKAIITKLN